MQLDEKIYHEYAGWQLENHELLTKLKGDGHNIYYRIKHVSDVIDYLYVQLTEDVNYSEDEDQIFQAGYFYLAGQVLQIKDLVDKYFNGDFKLANDHADEINLLLNTKDFQIEVLNNEYEQTKDVSKLLKFDEKLMKYFTDKKQIPPHIFEELDVLLSKIFDNENINYLTINNIFLEIADELNIL